VSNKLTTQSYFIKRLKDSGYEVWKMFDKYSESDTRSWTIIIDPGVSSVMCTCYVNHEEWEDTYFEFSDGGQFIPNSFKVRTDSIEVIVSYLVRYGINNKRSVNTTQ
jgi:hypothetical protein